MAVTVWEIESLDYDRVHPRVVGVAHQVIKLKPATLFEIGCSTGALRRLVETKVPGVDYWGCDISTLAVARHSDPQVVVADLNEEVPFPGKSFDCVVGSGILEYVADVPALFAALKSRLAPRGTLVVTYRNTGYWPRRLRAARGLEPWARADWKHAHSPRQVMQMLTDAGFRQVAARPAYVYAPRVGWLPRWAAYAPGAHALAPQLVFTAVA